MGHIHVGYDNHEPATSIDIIRAMDLFLGLESVVLDTDKERRRVYGKAGAYRFKKYGIEYRTLSTFWIENEKLIRWAFNKTQEAIEFVRIGGIITNPNDIEEAINYSNEELAMEILDDYNININELLILKEEL